jgi:hypothetical protein
MEPGSEPANDNAQLQPQVDAATDSRGVLSQILRDGTRRMLQATLQKVVKEHLQSRSAVVDEKGRKLIVRSGFLPEREVSARVMFQNRRRRSSAEMLKDSQQQQSLV